MSFYSSPKKVLSNFLCNGPCHAIATQGICTVADSSTIIIKLQICVNGLRQRFIWGLPLEHM